MINDLSILHAAQEAPQQVAVISGARTYTFGELAEPVRSVMAWLKRGVVGEARDGRVALVAQPNLETLIVLYALVESGSPAVLLHPRLTSGERARLVDDAAPSLVIEDAAAQFDEMKRTPSEPSEPAPPDDDRGLAILFTSGTTGRPKGAVLSRRAFVLAARASEANLGWERDDRWLLCMPPAHVGGLSIVLRCLHARRTVVLPSAEAKAGHFDPIAICSTIARDRVTIVSFVPTMLHRVFSAEPNWHGHVGLRAVLLGGAATSSKLLQAARERNVPVLTTYGLTEACSQVTTQKYGTPPSEEHGAGPPLLGTEVRIVDDQILVRGPSMMSSYFPPDAHPNPFLSDGWFPTGDSGRLDGKGCLHVAGRRRDLIVTGGENVYPAEVERQLEGWMGVRAAGVFGIADETWGQVVCAALVWDLSMPFVAPDVAKRLDSEFAPHKRPRFIALLPDLPLTQSGKIDRGRLAELAGPRLAAI